MPPGSDFGGSLGIYTSTKAAVTDLARSLAGAYGAKGIRFYSVNPAFFETALVKDGGKQYMPDMPEETKCTCHPLLSSSVLCRHVSLARQRFLA